MSPDRDHPGLSGGASKRPAPTIEGTATEVRPDPEPSEDKAKEARQPHGAGTAESAAEREETPRQPPKASGVRRSLTSHLLAVLLGAALAVLALYFAWDRLPHAQAPAMPPGFEQRLQALEAREAVQPEHFATLEERLGALEGKAGDDLDAEAVIERLIWLEDTIKSLAESAQEGGAVPDAAALATQLAEAEKRLEARLEARLERSVDDRHELEEMELAALKERLATIEAAMPVLSGAVDKQATEAKTAALILAFANLRAAVRSGEPYAPQLSAVTALSPTNRDLGALPAHADNGIPTLAELSRSFDASADAALQEASKPAEGSFVDRLLASAQTVVTVRRVGEVPGDEPDAVLARAKAKLNQGALDEAAAEIESLPQAERAAFADWLAQAHARLSAEATLRRLEASLLASLGADSAGQP